MRLEILGAFQYRANKPMGTDRPTRYASETAAKARRYVSRMSN